MDGILSTIIDVTVPLLFLLAVAGTSDTYVAEDGGDGPGHRDAVVVGGLREPTEGEQKLFRRVVAFAEEDMKAVWQKEGRRPQGESRVRLIAWSTLSVATIDPHRQYQAVVQVQRPMESGEPAWFLVHAICLFSVLDRETSPYKWMYGGQIDSPIQYFPRQPSDEDIVLFLEKSTFGHNYGGTTYRVIEVISYTESRMVLKAVSECSEFMKTYKPSLNDPTDIIFD